MRREFFSLGILLNICVFDFSSHIDKYCRRSFYGVKRYPEFIYYIRKLLRRQGIRSVSGMLGK
jgi:hypothetical protein